MKHRGSNAPEVYYSTGLELAHEPQDSPSDAKNGYGPNSAHGKLKDHYPDEKAQYNSDKEPYALGETDYSNEKEPYVDQKEPNGDSAGFPKDEVTEKEIAQDKKSHKRSRRRLIIAVVLIAIVVIVAAVIGGVLGSRSKFVPVQSVRPGTQY